MRKWCWLPLCAIALLLGRDTRRAHACGGASFVAPEVVEPPHLFGGDEETGLQREEARFLYPYLSAHPQEAKLLWQFSYESLLQVPAPNERHYLRALSAQQPDIARNEAQKLLDEWLALPPVLAAAHRDVAMRAAKFLEPTATGSKLSPTQQFLDLVQQFTTQVPNGWAAGAQNQVPPSFWAQQLATAQTWLADNPRHPLRDLVLLWQERVHYFAGDPNAAWSVLFQLYPRRRPRVFAEMRYLLQQNAQPTSAQLDAVTDPLLAASLLTQENASPARWERFWHLSEKAPSQAERTALQERLLQALVGQSRSGALPASFPKQAGKSSQWWGTLRGLLLLRHGQLAEAKAQLSMLEPSPEQATLLAACYLQMGDPVQAARTPSLNEVDVDYLIEVLTPLAQLPQLTSDPSVEVSVAANAALASDMIRRGDFLGAARWDKTGNPPEAAAFEHMAQLQKQGDELGLARALRERGQDLGVTMHSDYYRGFSTRFSQVKPDSAEAKGLILYFEATSGSFQALRHFVPWLEMHAKDKDAPAVLEEADSAYIALQSFGGWPDLFWVKYLTHHELAVRLRRVGKQIHIRARSPNPMP